MFAVKDYKKMCPNREANDATKGDIMALKTPKYSNATTIIKP
jgi:hypothetical protein